MSDPVTPEEYGLRAAKRQLKKDNASLVEQNLALRSKVSVLAAQLEAVKEQRKIDREEFQLACDQIDQLEAQLEAAQETAGYRLRALMNTEQRERELQAQLEAAQKAIAQLEADVEHRDDIIQRLRADPSDTANSLRCGEKGHQ